MAEFCVIAIAVATAMTAPRRTEKAGDAATVTTESFHGGQRPQLVLSQAAWTTTFKGLCARTGSGLMAATGMRA
ncbi:unnamed protein product [[Actinomadura] parvosata subsp. kistnae]|uniref:hypothetical protein n=1 Tax=[Actinomadura] parvosata TaxID=1955412 RepID=UPI000D28E0BB|nr:unnamed protein product [Actinomadura parvosata subsp. kistnae]